MSAADKVLDLLRGTPIRVHDGHVMDSDNVAKTISAPLPYVVFFSTPGAPTGRRRMSGSAGRGQEFMVNAVGETREQASLTGDIAEAALDGKRIPLGQRQYLHRADEDAFVRRDDTWTRPDGGPLFTDSRRYAIKTR
ncbi:hypothetical protein [Nocardioides sp. LHG3406-4]|uniref:hypothetical protein n=1 Tax=Nocardioides sp. LHG3406-4 TaxID=2804575 RepID=UPI003CE85479